MIATGITIGVAAIVFVSGVLAWMWCYVAAANDARSASARRLDDVRARAGVGDHVHRPSLASTHAAPGNAGAASSPREQEQNGG